MGRVRVVVHRREIERLLKAEGSTAASVPTSSGAAWLSRRGGSGQQRRGLRGP
jgi:hypothetical protein